MKGAFNKLSKISKGHSGTGSYNRDSKLTGSRSKLSQLSGRIINGADGPLQGRKLRNNGSLSPKEERIKMFMIAVNNSILRSKAIGFKQFSEVMQSQLKLKLAFHKIKKIMEERIGKVSITFMEKLLFAADLDIDLSERSSLFRSTLTYSLRQSTKSFWKNKNSTTRSRDGTYDGESEKLYTLDGKKSLTFKNGAIFLRNSRSPTVVSSKQGENNNLEAMRNSLDKAVKMILDE